MSAPIAGPRSRFENLRAYERSPLPPGVRLRLDANEGPLPALDMIVSALQSGGSDALRRYPDARPFEAALATHFGLSAGQVFVAAGADEVVDRCCRAFLPPDAAMVLAKPGFEMFEQYAMLCGARVITVPWPAGDYPRAAVCAAIDDSVAVVALITPNNPTGEPASLEDLHAIARAAPAALIILDHAYVEFAGEDLTAAAVETPNVVVVRTFSKVWGLAGCRVGYALGPERIMRVLRAVGGPFPVSSASLAIAGALLDRGTPYREAYVRRIHEERVALFAQLNRLGAKPRRSEANFVFAELGDATSRVRTALVERGIVVRAIARKPGEWLGLRISLPGDPQDFALLTAALEEVLSGDPQ
jgi:histidinol-phosphate aminotransferase